MGGANEELTTIDGRLSAALRPYVVVDDVDSDVQRVLARIMSHHEVCQ